MIERKKEVAETVVGTGEGWLTELTTAPSLDRWRDEIPF